MFRKTLSKQMSFGEVIEDIEGMDISALVEIMSPWEQQKRAVWTDGFVCREADAEGT